MITVEQMRKIEILDQNTQQWHAIALGQLTEGDTIRMYEPDGTPVKAEGGATIFVLTSRPSFQANFHKPVVPSGPVVSYNLAAALNAHETASTVASTTNVAEDIQYVETTMDSAVIPAEADAVVISNPVADFTPVTSTQEPAPIPDGNAFEEIMPTA